jgi:hypothetical protein
LAFNKAKEISKTTIYGKTLTKMTVTQNLSHPQETLHLLQKQV